MSEAPAQRPYAVEPGPPGTRFSEVRRFSDLDSTNRYLLDEARSVPRDGLVAVAEHQTAGRGRLGRRWEAPVGANLLVSVLLTPSLPVEQLHLCSVAVALSAAEACRRAAGLEPELKWPNDLLVGGRKLAGILAESAPMPSGGQRAVVVGLGLNVAWPPPEGERIGEPVPAELRSIATSVWRETAQRPDAPSLLELVLTDLEHRLVDLDDVAGRHRLAREYRSRCSTLGRAVRVVQADGEIHGTAMDITPEGHLLVDVGACFATVTAGDVVHVHTSG